MNLVIEGSLTPVSYRTDLNVILPLGEASSNGPAFLMLTQTLTRKPIGMLRISGLLPAVIKRAIRGVESPFSDLRHERIEAFDEERVQPLREKTPPPGRAYRNVGPPRLNFPSDGFRGRSGAGVIWPR